MQQIPWLNLRLNLGPVRLGVHCQRAVSEYPISPTFITYFLVPVMNLSPNSLVERIVSLLNVWTHLMMIAASCLNQAEQIQQGIPHFYIASATCCSSCASARHSSSPSSIHLLLSRYDTSTDDGAIANLVFAHLGSVRVECRFQDQSRTMPPYSCALALVLALRARVVARFKRWSFSIADLVPVLTYVVK